MKTNFQYEKIAAALREEVARNGFPGGKLPSERKLAEKYETNRLTLRKALNLLEDEKIIHRDSTRGTFIGRRKRTDSGKGKVVGLVLVGRSQLDRLHSGTILEMERQLKEYQSQLMLFSVAADDEVEGVLGNPVRSGLVDGLVVTGLTTGGLAKSIRRLGAPTVLLGHLIHPTPVEETFDRVHADSVEYGYQATRHLIDRDRRRVAMINGPSYQWFMNALAGYLRALDEAGLPHDESIVAKCDHDTPAEGVEAVDRLMTGAPPDAVFVANTRMCAGVLEKLKSWGKRVPDDVDVITVTTEHAELPPGVAAVRVSWEEMVRQALSLFFERFEDPEAEPMERKTRFDIDPG